MFRVFRYDDAILPDLIAVGYAVGGYLIGISILLNPYPWSYLPGVFLLAHSMVIAAYLVHECAHNSLFAKNRYHRPLAELLLWICGASYSHYDDIRHKHVRHHTDRADIVSFNYREILKRHPRVLKIILALEWCCVPALEILMHALVLVLPFVKANRRHRRGRVVLMLLLRGLFFAWLASMSLNILWFYPLAYMLFLTVMRFMDVHQHTFALHETLDRKRGEEVKPYDRDFERRHTYSNLLSQQHPWLNLLVLNFPYHNAHHEQPGIPWYRLPGLHKKLYGVAPVQVLTFRNLLKAYHRYRVQRVLNEDSIDLDVKRNDSTNFIGVDGVSFLTAH